MVIDYCTVIITNIRNAAALHPYNRQKTDWKKGILNSDGTDQNECFNIGIERKKAWNNRFSAF